MLFKFFILGAILLASAALGNAVAARTAQHLREVNQAVNCIKGIKNRMLYQRMPLCAAMDGAQGLGAFPQMCAGILRKHPGLTGREACQRAFQMKGALPETAAEPERHALIALVDGLAAAETAQQLADVFSAYFREMGEILRDVKENQIRKARLVRSMCMTGGLAVAILLI